MKTPAVFELSCVAGGLMVVTLAVLWVQRPADGCAWLPEAPRRLVLSRETDREHLTTDLASADRIARRYMLTTADPSQQRARFVECEATLARQIATTHGLSPDLVRAGPTDGQ